MSERNTPYQPIDPWSDSSSAGSTPASSSPCSRAMIAEMTSPCSDAARTNSGHSDSCTASSRVISSACTASPNRASSAAAHSRSTGSSDVASGAYCCCSMSCAEPSAAGIHSDMASVIRPSIAWRSPTIGPAGPASSPSSPSPSAASGSRSLASSEAARTSSSPIWCLMKPARLSDLTHSTPRATMRVHARKVRKGAGMGSGYGLPMVRKR